MFHLESGYLLLCLQTEVQQGKVLLASYAKRGQMSSCHGSQFNSDIAWEWFLMTTFLGILIELVQDEVQAQVFFKNSPGDSVCSQDWEPVSPA